MKKIIFLLPAIAVLLLSFKPIAPASWKLDAVHSNLGFTVLHLGVSDFKGTVKLNSAVITAPNEDFTDASIVLEADMNSINTNNDKRDDHLKTADFFNTVKFPVLNFQSTSFKKDNADKYIITGNLTLHGVTKPVTLTASIRSGVNPTNNKPITGIKVMGTIKRTDFDIAPSTPVGILSDEVAIEANMEFGKE